MDEMNLEFLKPVVVHTLATACRWSPNGRYLASASKHELIVRLASPPPQDGDGDHALPRPRSNTNSKEGDLDVLHVFACREVIEEVRWAPDSQWVMCASYAKHVVQVFTLADPQWTAVIDEETLLPAGLTAARWAPDSRHLLLLTDFQLYVLVWSLEAGAEVQHVAHPKFSWTSSLEPPQREGNPDARHVRPDEDHDITSGLRGLHFSHRGRYLAVAQRQGCKDFISIYDCIKQWTLAKRIAVDTQDLGDFAWSPDDRSICVWEAPHMPYKVLVYPLGGPTAASAPGQRRAQSLCLYKDQLSIKTAAWSPDTQYIAVGSYDQTVRLINSRTWKVEMEFKHTQAAARASTDASVFCEVERWQLDGTANDEDFRREKKARSRTTVYGISSEPVEFAPVRADPLQANAELGIGMLSWSHDGSHFFTRNDSVPNVLWIWDAVKMSLVALLVQKHPIKSARWHPTETRLVLCTANRTVYLWSPTSCHSCDLPRETKLHVRDISWNPTGDSLLLVDQKAFSACYMPLAQS